MCSSRMQNVRGETAVRGSHGKVEVGAMVYATIILASSQSCRIEQWTRHSLLRTRSRAQLPNDCPPLYHAPKQIDRSPPGFFLLPSSAGASVYSNVVSHSILFRVPKTRQEQIAPTCLVFPSAGLLIKGTGLLPFLRRSTPT